MSSTLKQLQEFDFNNIEWERMGVWPTPIKVVFCLFIVVVILAGGFFGVVKPSQAELQRLQAEETRLMRDYEAKAFQVANLDAYRNQLVEMRQAFESVLRQLPNDTEIPDLLVDINETALSSGLQVGQLSIGTPTQRELFVEQPLRLEATGGYHEIGTFVSGISALPRIVTLHDYTLQPINAAGDSRLRLAIDVRTYQYREAGGATR
ncbi:type 4a pilus biogenesis protein PilO [Salinispirillum marinum]|uniref:Type 4a pilus biogenesis protein PilO n=2 Tax=Saccharospirillaceae TaxID=255527 RepID=A0ABV8BF18_9GAMM